MLNFSHGNTRSETLDLFDSKVTNSSGPEIIIPEKLIIAFWYTKVMRIIVLYMALKQTLLRTKKTETYWKHSSMTICLVNLTLWF